MAHPSDEGSMLLVATTSPSLSTSQLPIQKSSAWNFCISHAAWTLAVAASRKAPPMIATFFIELPARPLSNGHDPQALVRRIPPLLAQGQPQDRQAPQPRHLRLARRGEEARARGAVLQAPLAASHRSSAGR